MQDAKQTLWIYLKKLTVGYFDITVDLDPELATVFPAVFAVRTIEDAVSDFRTLDYNFHPDFEFYVKLPTIKNKNKIQVLRNQFCIFIMTSAGPGSIEKAHLSFRRTAPI